MKQIINYSIKRNAVIAIIGLSFLISGCMDDVYDPNYRTPVPDELKDLEAPTDFDWSTTQNIELNICVHDEYEGKYYYEVSVYDSNPFFDENAQLLTKGLAKENKNFSAVVTVPKDIEQLFVCQSLKMKDGSKQEYVRIVDITADHLSCNFAGTDDIENEPQSLALKNKRKESDNIKIPSNAIAIEGNSKVKPEDSKIYVVRTGTTYNGEFIFTDNNATIYVSGTFAPTSQINGNNNKIIILEEGVLRTNQDVNLNNSTHIINYGTAELNSGCTISGNNTYIENHGNITIAKEVSMNSWAKFHNQNHAKIGGSVYITNKGSNFTNEGQLYVSGNFKVDSDAQFDNKCYAQIDGILVSGVDPENINIYSDGMISCKQFETDWGKGITLYPYAILDITESAKLSGNTVINNPDNGNNERTALIKINALKDGSFNEWNKLTFKGAIQLYLAHGKIDKNETTGSVEFIKNLEDAVVIERSGCNGEGNNASQPDKEPEGSTFPIIVSPDNTYTFLMEDNWPVYGDYDMNDLVMDIELEYEEDNGYIKELEIEATLRAVGASKSLAAAIQLDKVPVTAIEEVKFEDINKEALDGSVFDCINGLEKDQQYAVIPFFDNAHRVLGVENGTLINTGKEDHSVKNQEFEIDIKFKNNTVKRKDINIKNLNFFIVTDRKKQGRKEVHLKGFEPTQKASRIFLNSNSDNYNVAPYLSKDNLIWGLMISSNEKKRFNYPKENKNIKDAYPKFGEWATSGGTTNKDWYKLENARKEYIYNN